MSSAPRRLAHSDTRLLESICVTGRALEQAPQDLELLAKLKALIASASEAKSESLRRLSFHERDLTPEMTTKHLTGIMVPFERLHGRALRDDEFIVIENDKKHSPRESSPLIVIADNLRSAFNVGAILRTAEALGAERAILTGYTPTPNDKKTAQTSMGTQEVLPWESVAHVKDAISALKETNYVVVALETAEGAEGVDDFIWPEKCAILLGNERFGIDSATLALADHIVRIPLYGQKNSLNVGIAFGIAASAWRRNQKNGIATFHCAAKNPYEARRQGVLATEGEIGIVELKAGHSLEQALTDLEGFERIWLIYKFHQNKNWKPMVMPPRGPRVKRGVFATRSPYRPSGIGLSCVELIGIEGRKISVRGYDLLDGTPILDIKPYLPYADSFPSSKAGWTDTLDKEKFTVTVSRSAEDELTFLEERGVTQLRSFMQAQLEFAPIDDERKRVTALETHYCLSYRTWRIDFNLAAEGNLITVLGIRSGYSSQDLADPIDRYDDKKLHREFLSAFA